MKSHCCFLFYLATGCSLLAQTQVLFEGFEGNFLLDNGWNVSGTNAAWGVVTNGFAGRTAADGGHFVYCAATRAGGSPGGPIYPSNMDGSMSRSIDLRPYAAGELKFWYLMADIATSQIGGVDYFQVKIDNVPVFGPMNGSASGWQPVTLNLRNFTGAVHTLTFEFVSGTDFLNHEGIYLDDILVVGQKTLPASVLVNDRSRDLTPYVTQNEPTVAVAPGGVVLAAFNDSGSLRASALKFTGRAISTNAGASFRDMATLPSGPYGDSGDPVLQRDSTSGVIYLATIVATNSASGAGQEIAPGSIIQVFRSTDNGQFFHSPVNGAPGFVAGDALDKPWLAVDNFPGTGQGIVYLVFRDFPSSAPGTQQQGIYLTSSLDGGLTWGPAQGRLVGVNGQGAFVVVGPQHQVYVFWLNPGTGARIQMSKSLDQGMTFGGISTVASISSTKINGDLGLNTRTDSFPRAAVNPVTGDLYVVFNDKGLLTGDLADVFVTMSSDGGATWTARQRLNKDWSLRSQWFPCLCVSPDGRNLFAAWYDRRLEDNSWSDSQTTYGIFASITGTIPLFGSDFRIGDNIFKLPASGSDPAVKTFLGDYIQAVADSEYVYFAWTDCRSGDADIRLAKIPIPDRFTRIAVQNGVAHLTFNTNPGRSYSLDRSVDLRNWTTLPISTITATDFSTTFNFGAPAVGAGFYRASVR